MRYANATTTLAVLLALGGLVACGSGDDVPEAAAVQQTEAAEEAHRAESGEASAPGVDLPPDFPDVPMPRDATVESVVPDGSTFNVFVTVHDTRPNVLFGVLGGQLKTDGWTWEIVTQDGEPAAILAQRGDDRYEAQMTTYDEATSRLGLLMVIRVQS